MKIKLLLFIIIICSFACKKKSTDSQATIDDKAITKYLSDNKLSATATGSGLYYIITTQGTGVNPQINSTVTVNYKGYLTDGTVFDQTSPSGATFGLSQVIKGWQEGIPYFKKGGKGKLLIPSALGYGSQATGSIPPNSVLIFDIELINVQ